MQPAAHDCAIHPGPLEPILLQRVGVDLPSRIEAALADRTRLTDEALADLEAALVALAEEVGRRLEAMLDGDPIGGTPTEASFAGLREGEQVKAQVLAMEWQGLAAIIESAGLATARTSWFRRYGELVVAAERQLGAAGAAKADTLLDSEAVAEGIESLFRRHDDALFGTIQRQSSIRILDALQQQVGLRTHREIAADIAEAEGLTVPQAMAEAETRVAEADRYFVAVAAEQASAGEADAFLYAYGGPVDAKTRPFCRRIVGKALSLDQVNDLRNGQLPTPLYTGGGYRCRHLFVPVLAGTLDDLPYTRGTDADVAAANAAVGSRGKKGTR